MAERSTDSNSQQQQLTTALRHSLRAGGSLFAIGCLLASAAAHAQDDPSAAAAADAAAEDDNAIIVTGIRASLANSQDIKRDSDTVVDAITAADIGALPDRSVTEALQRLPGVSINRFAGSNDPDHFSVEGSGVVVRGLNFVRSEFNGRTAFAAGVGGQALNFADVPSELLGSVIVSKNATADMIEGGLAGTVNLNTRKPFDNNGFHVAFGVEANYGDMREEWTPTLSGLISNTWEGDYGTFGLLASASFSQIKSRADGLQIANYQNRDGVAVRASNTTDRLICRNPLPGSTDTMTLPGGNALCGNLGTAGADGFADYDTTRVAPVGGQFRTQEFDRKRDGISVAMQWESTDGRTNITAEFIRSHSTNAWGEHTYEAAPDLSDYSTYPIGCRQNANGPNVIDSNGVINPDDETPPRAQCPVGGFTDYVYDENGLFQSGYIVDASNGWRGASGNPFVPIGGSQYSLARRQVLDEITNADYSLNIQHELADNLRIAVDGQYAQSQKENLDMSVFGSLFADSELDISGKAPLITPHKPQFLGYTWSAPAEPLASATDAEYFSDPRFQFWRAAMDHAEDSKGDQYALRGDLEYDFTEDSFLRSAKAGARYQSRDQTVRYTTYNWGMLSEVWSGSRPVHFGDTESDGRTARYDYPDFWRGKVQGPPGAFYYTGDLIEDYNGSVDYFQSVQDRARDLGANPSWVPLAERDSVVNGAYLPSDIQRVKQDDFSAYAMLRFDTETSGGMRIAGNVGLRYVSTKVSSASSRGPGTDQALGIADPYDVRCQERDIPAEAGGGTARPGGICLVGQQAYEDLQDFADGSFKYEKIEHDYDYLLPSLNVRLNLTDEVLLRFAASRVMTQPENGYIRNYFVAGIDTSGNYTGSAGDPTLDPAVAWQFDLTAEWYFSRVGSLTFDVFYKSIDNFFYQSVREDTIENASGETRGVLVRGPANYDGTGKVKGFELAYQQTYDFLPAPFDGFGLSGNYTYIDSSGLPNTFLNGGQVPNNSTVPPGNLPLEQLSKHNVNVALFYEKGPLSVRAAYNWRSRFLLTASDVIIPYYSIFNEPTGQLDASIFFNVTDQIKIGLQGVNLTNEVTKTSQAYTGDPNVLAPRSYFMNDRRYSIILRGNF